MSRGPEWAFQEDVLIPLLELAGFDVHRTADVNPKYQADYGTPDLYCRHTGKQVRVWIEVKAPDARRGATEHQQLFIETEREAGGHAWVIDSADALSEKLHDEFGINLEVAT